jgi:SAM-dependent methyltransferase
MVADNGSRDGYREMAFLVRAQQISKMIEVAATLGLADRIDGTPRSVDQLAAECGAHPGALLRLCRGLAAFEIFSVDTNNCIGHTARSRLLRTDSVPTVHYASRYYGLQSNWVAWSALEHTVRTGTPAFEERFGMPYFDFLHQRPEESEIFHKFMQSSPDDRHNAVANAYDFSNARLVVDIGGGNGALLAAILGKNPTVRGVLFDRPAVVADAEHVLGNVSDRCEIDAGSFFDRVTAGADVYLLSQVIHDWDDERAIKILTNIRRAMAHGGRLLIIERFLSEAPDGALAISYLSDIHMMVLFPGARERTTREYASLLGQAGFASPLPVMTQSPFYILEAMAAA